MVMVTGLWLAGCGNGLLETGAGGAGGGRGGSALEATQVPCPAARPSGACNFPRLTCPYETGTCTCTDGTWACVDCPAARPIGGAPCVAGGPFDCHYEGVTCGCAQGAAWLCGVCPGNQPANNDSCGDPGFTCHYPGATCVCQLDGWGCGADATSCPTRSTFYLGCPGAVSTPAVCQYPDEQQSCSCFGGAASWLCTCPTSLPATGDRCAGLAECQFGSTTCGCFGGPDWEWQCTPHCPSARPPDGSACSGSLSCNYASLLCTCASGVWHCS